MDVTPSLLLSFRLLRPRWAMKNQACALLHRDADDVPGGTQGVHEGRVDGAAVGDRLVSDLLEVGAGADALGRIRAPQRLPPGLEGTVESEVAVRGVDRERGESAVHDTAIDMNAAVVLAALVATAVVVRLRILAEVGGVVVGRARVHHVTKGATLDRRAEEAGADEPVEVLGLDVVGEHLDQRAADVGTRLVGRARLVPVLESGGELRHAVEDLVADDTQDDEGDEDDAVAVAVGHLLAVPEGVGILEAVMDGSHEVHALGVDALDLQDLLEEVAHVAVVLVSEVDGLVAGGRGAVCADELAREAALAAGVVDLDLSIGADPGVTRTTRLALTAVVADEQRVDARHGPHEKVVRQVDGPGGEAVVQGIRASHFIEHVARHDSVTKSHHSSFPFGWLG